MRPSPMPRHWKSSRSGMPVRRQKTSSRTVWATTPRVAVPASSVIIAPSQPSSAERLAEQDHEQHEPGNRDHVVDDRSPGVRTEHPSRVEDLAQQREHAVEEQLRHAPVRELGRKSRLLRAEVGVRWIRQR